MRKDDMAGTWLAVLDRITRRQHLEILDRPIAGVYAHPAKDLLRIRHPEPMLPHAVPQIKDGGAADACFLTAQKVRSLLERQDIERELLWMGPMTDLPPKPR